MVDTEAPLVSSHPVGQLVVGKAETAPAGVELIAPQLVPLQSCRVLAEYCKAPALAALQATDVEPICTSPLAVSVLVGFVVPIPTLPRPVRLTQYHRFDSIDLKGINLLTQLNQDCIIESVD